MRIPTTPLLPPADEAPTTPATPESADADRFLQLLDGVPAPQTEQRESADARRVRDAFGFDDLLDTFDTLDEPVHRSTRSGIQAVPISGATIANTGAAAHFPPVDPEMTPSNAKARTVSSPVWAPQTYRDAIDVMSTAAVQPDPKRVPVSRFGAMAYETPPSAVAPANAGDESTPPPEGRAVPFTRTMPTHDAGDPDTSRTPPGTPDSNESAAPFTLRVPDEPGPAETHTASSPVRAPQTYRDATDDPSMAPASPDPESVDDAIPAEDERLPVLRTRAMAARATDGARATRTARSTGDSQDVVIVRGVQDEAESPNAIVQAASAETRTIPTAAAPPEPERVRVRRSGPTTYEAPPSAITTTRKDLHEAVASRVAEATPEDVGDGIALPTESSAVSVSSTRAMPAPAAPAAPAAPQTYLAATSLKVPHSDSGRMSATATGMHRKGIDTAGASRFPDATPAVGEGLGPPSERSTDSTTRAVPTHEVLVPDEVSLGTTPVQMEPVEARTISSSTTARAGAPQTYFVAIDGEPAAAAPPDPKHVSVARARSGAQTMHSAAIGAGRNKTHEFTLSRSAEATPAATDGGLPPSGEEPQPVSSTRAMPAHAHAAVAPVARGVPDEAASAVAQAERTTTPAITPERIPAPRSGPAPHEATRAMRVHAAATAAAPVARRVPDEAAPANAVVPAEPAGTRATSSSAEPPKTYRAAIRPDPQYAPGPIAGLPTREIPVSSVAAEHKEIHEPSSPHLAGSTPMGASGALALADENPAGSSTRAMSLHAVAGSTLVSSRSTDAADQPRVADANSPIHPVRVLGDEPEAAETPSARSSGTYRTTTHLSTPKDVGAPHPVAATPTTAERPPGAGGARAWAGPALVPPAPLEAVPRHDPAPAHDRVPSASANSIESRVDRANGEATSQSAVVAVSGKGRAGLPTNTDPVPDASTSGIAPGTTTAELPAALAASAIADAIEQPQNVREAVVQARAEDADLEQSSDETIELRLAEANSPESPLLRLLNAI